MGATLLQKTLDEGVVTNAVAPYEFSPDVIAAVRARVQTRNKERN